MIIPVEDIPFEGLHVVDEDPPEAYDLSYGIYAVNDPIKLDLLISRVGDRVIAHGSLTYKLKTECIRCLQEMDLEETISDYRNTWEVHGEQSIDLTEKIREDIILTFPVKPLCGSECSGLCRKCGKNLNIDPCSCDLGSGNNTFAILDTLDIE